jgi:hypothetical protein
VRWWLRPPIIETTTAVSATIHVPTERPRDALYEAPGMYALSVVRTALGTTAPQASAPAQVVRLPTIMVAALLCLLGSCLWTVEHASGGDPVTIRVLDPQGRDAGTLSFPDRDDVGTGTFDSIIPAGALATDPFVRVGTAAPVDGPPGEFHITVAASISKRLVTVELRRLPRTEPVFRVALSLPRDFDPMRRHVIEVTFAKWNVSGVTMDGQALSPPRKEGASAVSIDRSTGPPTERERAFA